MSRDEALIVRQDAWDISDNGRSIILKATLPDSISGAFLIDLGLPCPWDTDGDRRVSASGLLANLGSFPSRRRHSAPGRRDQGIETGATSRYVPQASRPSLQGDVLEQDSACHHRVRSEARDKELGFPGKGVTLVLAKPPDAVARRKVVWEMEATAGPDESGLQVSLGLRGRCREIVSPPLPIKSMKIQSSDTAPSGVVWQGVSP